MRTPLTAAFSVVLAVSSAIAADPRPLTAWRAMDGRALPPTWTIAGDEIRHAPGGGDIRSEEQFVNFTLDFEWTISPGGNSGVFYRATAGSALNGPEYQILDNDGHPDGSAALTSAASAYGVYPPTRDATRPVGEWNAGRIVVDGQHVEHWLNGEMVLSYQLGSTDWQQRVAASKFHGTAYGQATQGYIVLQDHGDPVAYRNMMISER